MTERNIITQTAKHAVTPIAGSILQRAFACGQSTTYDGQCKECNKDNLGRLQRSATNSIPVKEVPSLAQEVLRLPGQPPDVQTRAFIEPRFGHDFSNVANESKFGNLSQGKGGKSMEVLSGFDPEINQVGKWCAKSRSWLLPSKLVENYSAALNVALPNVRVHGDLYANLVALSHQSEAVSIGSDIFLSAHAKTPGLIAHELAHVAQAVSRGPRASVHDLEKEAMDFQEASLTGSVNAVQLSASPLEPMMHPATRILARAGRWLATRGIATVSRHVARHARRIAARAVHTIFRNPREIRALLSRTVREATEIARRTARHGMDDVIEGGGIRIFRQATRTPGKYRIVIQKQFHRDIGTRGERILNLVLDMSGRVVTAYPIDRFLLIGLTTGAASIFQEQTAEAADRIHSLIEAEAEAEEERPTDWVGETIAFFNPIDEGATAGETRLDLEIDEIVTQTTRDVIQEIEDTHQVSLGPEQRNAIEELVRLGLVNPSDLETLEDE